MTTPYMSSVGQTNTPAYPGQYQAIVVNNHDPLGVGRLQLNIPQVLGAAVSAWAVPAGTYYTIPDNGTAVIASFLGGDPSQPTWMGPLDISPEIEAAAPPTVTYSVSEPPDPRVNDIWYPVNESVSPQTVGPPQIYTYNSSTSTYSWVTQPSIGNTAIATGAVTGGLTGSIAEGTITADNIKANTITGEQIEAEVSLSAPIINGGTITGTNVIVQDNGTIQSADFVHGSTGWSINYDGSAEFHDISIPAGSAGTEVTIGPMPASANIGDIWYDTFNGLEANKCTTAYTSGGTSANWTSYQIGTNAIGTGAVGSNQISEVNGDLIDPGSLPAIAAGFQANDIGGNTVTIGTTPPTTPNPGDMWINSAAGNQMNQYTQVTYDFEDGTDGWNPQQGVVAQVNTWSNTGQYSLQVTANSATSGNNDAVSPLIPVIAGTIVTASAVINSTSALPLAGITFNWYNSSSTYISTATGQPTSSLAAGQITTVSWSATAPANTAFVSAAVGDFQTDANGTTYMIDTVIVGAWTPYQFGNQAIAANSISSNELQANSVVSGVIDAGAIDGMTINSPTINSGTISASDIIVSGNNGGIFGYEQGAGGQIVQTYTSSGTWTAPAGITSIKVEAWGGGAGGGGGSTSGGGKGGGGGEYAAESTLAVTPGNTYSFTVGAAGAAGANGGNSTFAGNSVTVTAHGGTTTAGGTGSSNTTHYNGGAPGAGSPGTSTTQTFTSSTTWTAPTGVSSVSVKAYGGGAGGQWASGPGGGGGEYVAEPNVTVTPGSNYTVAIGSGGSGGNSSSGPGGAGGNTTFNGSPSVTAHGAPANNTGGTSNGGSGSTNSTHHNGGGGKSTGGAGLGGGGGAASGNSAATGATGAAASGATPGGGASGANGGGGGAGGGWGSEGGHTATAGGNGGTPGGGGGSGGATSTSGENGGSGGHGQLSLTYVNPANAGGGGGGASGWSGGAGNSGAAGSSSTGGAAGAAQGSGGAGGDGGNSGVAGTAGTGPGGGGGGGGSGSAGGAGSAGQIRVTYTAAGTPFLAASFLGANGTDPFGSTAQSGITAYGQSGSYVNIWGGPSEAEVYLGTGDVDQSSAGIVGASIGSSGSTRTLQTYVQSPVFNNNTNGYGYLELSSPSYDGTTTTSYAYLGAQNGTSGATYAELDIDASASTPFVAMYTSATTAPTNASWMINSSGQFISDNIYAFDPSQTNPTAEGWHSFSLPSGLTGTGVSVTRYRMTAIKTVQIEVDILATNSTSGTTVMLATLPSAYAPASERRFPVFTTSSSYIVCYGYITGTSLQIIGWPISANIRLGFFFEYGI